MAEEKNLFQKIMDTQARLEELRRPHESLYKEVIEFLRPELSKWDTENESVGEKRNIDVYSASPEEALENWADGMQGHLVSSSLDWFNYVMSEKRFNDLPEVRKWRQDSRDIIYSIFRDSNFYPSLSPVFRDAGSIGDATLWIDSEDGVEFKTFHPRELYHDKGILHRVFELSAREAAKQFDEKKLSNTLKNDLDNNPFARHKFIHACYKSDARILVGEEVPDREYISIYIEQHADLDKKEPLSVKGYHTKPYARWMYSVASDSRYGWGLGCSAIVDVYTLNEIAKTNMQAQQLAVDPPIIADKSLRGRINRKPHGITWRKNKEEAYETTMDRLNIPFGLDREDRLAAAIDRRFNVDFFLMLARAQKPMTATEILERSGEKSILMGPKIGRMEVDLLNPVHERIFSLALENGWLPDPPDILLYESDGRIDVEYVGPLAQAQKRLFEIRRNERTMAAVSPILSLYPEARDYLDGNKSFVRILRDDDWPEEEIRPEEEVAALRQQRAQQEAAMRQMEMAKEAADAVPKLSKEVEPGSVMAEMSG